MTKSTARPPSAKEPAFPPIVMYGLCRWDYIVNRPQNLAQQLARHTDVYYIDPPLAASEVGRSVQQLGRHILGPSLTLAPRDNGVVTIRTKLRLPFSGKLKTVEAVNHRLLARALASFAKRLPRPPALWVMYPAEHRLFSRFPKSCLVYDLVDRHSHFPGQPATTLAAIERGERWLFDNADLVTVTSRSLNSYALEAGAKYVASLPNGCDSHHFGRAVRPPTHSPSPVIGYVGALGEWIDFDAIASVARALPSARVVLAGPFHAPVEKLPPGLPDNVEHVGVLDYKILPDFMKQFDLALIPFLISSMTEAVNPVKVYEYLAAGKPVLATPLPELMPLSDVVDIQPADGFAAAAQRLIAADSMEQIEKRLATAAENSWQTRAEVALAMIAETSD